MQQTIRRSLPLQYALPVSLTALAVALWWLLAPSLGLFAPFMLMYPVVMVGGWYGGLRPALLATLLTTVARIVLSSHPVGDLSSLGSSDWVQIALYATIAALISGLSEAMHRARRQAEEQTLRSQHHERELARSEERFRLAADAVNCLIYDWDPLSGRAERTRGLFELTGFHPEEAVPDNDWWNGRIHPEDREQAIAAVADAVRDGRHFEATYRIQHRDGHYIPVWDQGLILRDDEGRITRVVGSTVDMSEQIRASNERLAIEDRLRRAVTAARIGEWEWDIPADTATRSPATDDLVGTDAGHSGPAYAEFIKRIAPQDRERVENEIRATIAAGETFDVEYRLLHPDGSTRWIADRGEVVRDAGGEAIRMLGVSIDIDAQKRAEEALMANQDAFRLAKEEAEAANSAKDHFIAVLSHELRTPLSPVLIMAQTLESTPGLDEEMRSGLEIIRRNAELEARLIDDLLDLTRISRGKLQLSIESADLHDLIGNAIEISREDITARGQQVGVDLAASNARMKGDPARLQQVFWNVIKNAVKFTPVGGSITIRTSGSGSLVVVEVIDTGIGIEPEMLPRIFNAFEQGERASMPHFGGLGLGLAVSRALVEMHGGKISASSEGTDRGTTLRIELPVLVDQPDDAAMAPDTPAPDAKEGEKLRILLVDDHKDTSMVFSILLRSHGYTVVTAHNVADGLAQALAGRFDLLISDISMPDGTGLDLVRKIRERQPVRAIALSGFGMEEDIRRSLDGGFIDHLVKPVSQQRLFDAITRALADPADPAVPAHPPATTLS